MAGIAPHALAELIDHGRAPSVLDVRSENEFRGGHVPGAIHIPFNAVRKETTVLPFTTGDPIVVYCAHGPRAWIAGAALKRRGFTQVIYLSGHMRAWKRMRLPVQCPSLQP